MAPILRDICHLIWSAVVVLVISVPAFFVTLWVMTDLLGWERGRVSGEVPPDYPETPYRFCELGFHAVSRSTLSHSHSPETQHSLPEKGGLGCPDDEVRHRLLEDIAAST